MQCIMICTLLPEDTLMTELENLEIAIIGGGPAGLMSAEVLAHAGLAVTVFEAKPSLGRKFLRAGIGGLNLTHGEDYAQFVTRFGERSERLKPVLDAFPPESIRAWAAGLGVETFKGSSGRVFPVDMKAAPLLRAWVQRLRGLGVSFRLRHRWQGWNEAGALLFTVPDGEVAVQAGATILALGGASWPQLGSDGAWVPWLEARGVSIAPLQTANCGFQVDWSPHLQERFAGAQVKPVVLSLTDADGVRHSRQGEFIVTQYGVEGSLIYALSRPLRDTLARTGSVKVELDLTPGRSVENVFQELARPRGSRSMSSHLQSRLGVKGVKAALLRESLGPQGYGDAILVARAIKALPVELTAPRPLHEAISTAGGVRFEALDDHLMFTSLPGTFAAGEMLDWEAPTGGYLLSACLAQGRWAAEGVRHWLQRSFISSGSKNST